MGAVVLELRKANESVSIMIWANFRTLLQSVGNLKKFRIVIFGTVKRAILWRVHGLRLKGLVLEAH
jgi:hypothetical protein